ncbi:amidohydrolase family protein [Dermatobacter hominis]|uniref:amidohydrolase family protein n=1 Tax=Dermatobacter hominis TaxID=2884263 RepID=UPI001D11519D|nr:amidohydrolase family protein [Dermatobacter hominis]UDY35049.1 amidohydrolase [Dermatobacter hominis]
MSELGFRPFDADQHYYEAEDAFTRHIEKGMAKRCMQWAEIDGRRRLLVGGRVNKFIPNPTFDPIARPGSLEDYFRGRNTEGLDLKTMFGELDPISEHPAYRVREARVRLLDEQGLDGALLFPTLGVGMQEALRRDLPALHAAFRAFNRWLDEDWGFDRGDGRLYAAPMIALAEPELAAAEVERVLGDGAKVLVTIPGPVPDGEDGYVSPAHPRFDRVWGLVAEAGVPMVLHAGLSGVAHYGRFWRTQSAGDGGGGFEGFKHASFPLVAFADRGISDSLAAMICHGLFERFPTLRIASIENGAMWVPDLLRNLRDAHGKMPFAFADHPVEQFRRNVWVAPYYEDDMARLRDAIGIDRLLFGSDFPHTEGLPEPVRFVEDIPEFDRDETRAVMSDNVRDLLHLAPVTAAV